MQPAPLTGTATPLLLSVKYKKQKDAARTPHGDSNKQEAAATMPRIKMQPAPLTGTATLYLLPL